MFSGNGKLQLRIIEVRVKLISDSNDLSIVVFGIVLGGVLTRFLEDSNLLVNGVLTAICTIVCVLIWKSVKRIGKAMRWQRRK